MYLFPYISFIFPAFFLFLTRKIKNKKRKAFKKLYAKQKNYLL